MTPATPRNFGELVNFLIDILSLAIPLLFALALIVVAWRLIDVWIIHPDDTDKLAEGRSLAWKAVLILAVMSSVWGILYLLRHTFFGN